MIWASATTAVDAIVQMASRRGATSPRVIVSGNHATPRLMLNALNDGLPQFTVWALNAQHGMPEREGVTLETCFVGPGMRRSPHLKYVPARLSLVPVLFRSTLRPDAVIVNVSRVVDQKVSLGAEVNVLPAAIEHCRASGGVVIAQVNEHMPYTYGDGELALETFDYLVQGDEPLFDTSPPPTDDVAAAIGERLAHCVEDGATLQLGIGAVPHAALPGLTQRRGLRIWSELVSDGVITLTDEGVLDPGAPVTASFVLGSHRLYEWVDENPGVRILRTETTNDPAIIASNPRMISLNAALQVDLFGQANASRINRQIYSGLGGQTDFVVGALHSSGGKALIAMRSWQPKSDASTIVALLDEPVTSFQHSAIVTEHGLARIWGCSQREQAQNLIAHAAHPAARDRLSAAAAQLGLS